jgi:hypothetical protein
MYSAHVVISFVIIIREKITTMKTGKDDSPRKEFRLVMRMCDFEVAPVSMHTGVISNYQRRDDLKKKKY